MRARLAAALALLLGAGSAGEARAQIDCSTYPPDPRCKQVDRTTYSIHVDVASQVDLAELRLYLAEANQLLQQDQGANDVACCMSLAAVPPSTPPNRPDSDALLVFGTPGDGLDVISDKADWDAVVGVAGSGSYRRAIVQTINWCGVPGTFLGCGTIPGNSLAVALDAGPERLGMVIAHERGHNANLAHRPETCALMAPSVTSTNGCLTASECSMYRAIFGVTTAGTCDCMGAAMGDPVDPNGSACSAEGGAGFCHHDGLCDAPPPNDVCLLATPLSGALAWLDDDYNAAGEGSATCGPGSADVWYRYTPACTGWLDVDLCDADPDVQVSAHRSCAARSGDELVCSAACGAPRPGCRAGGACASAPAQAGVPLWLRVASASTETGPFVLRASCRPAALPDADGDGVTDAFDNCARWPNSNQTDTDGNWIGNACECGDQDGNGTVNTSDLIAINTATFNPALATPLCDTNQDALCNVSDITGANRKIFGGAAYCSRYPAPASVSAAAP